MDFSVHSLKRAAQRNLAPEDVAYILTYGQRFHRAGALIAYLRRRDIPEWDRALNCYARLAGTAVIITRDGRTVITVWRNQRTGLKRIRKKPEFSCRETTGGWQ